MESKYKMKDCFNCFNCIPYIKNGVNIGFSCIGEDGKRWPRKKWPLNAATKENRCGSNRIWWIKKT